MWVKICGIRDVQTAVDVAACGPDAVGLNFYAQSSRRVTPDVAAEIVGRLPGDVLPIGLFVNAGVEEIVQTCDECGISTVQLHGDEPIELLAELSQARPEFRLIRAFRIGERGLAGMTDVVDGCRQRGVRLWACLVDADVAGRYGGTGQRAPWELLAAEPRDSSQPPLILAGGLNDENVADAVAAVGPWGMDVAGGVESSAGVKDLGRVERFIRNARQASDTQ